MKPHAFLINIARGDVVIERDLIKALRDGAIVGAMLDVFQQEPSAGQSAMGNAKRNSDAAYRRKSNKLPRAGICNFRREHRALPQR